MKYAYPDYWELVDVVKDFLMDVFPQLPSYDLEDMAEGIVYGYLPKKDLKYVCEYVERWIPEINNFLLMELCIKIRNYMIKKKND